MNYTFFHRPEYRKFRYIPQFYVPEENKIPKSSTFNSDEFAERLHRSWNSKRQNKKKNTGNVKTIIWIMLILFLLIYLYYKFF